MAKTSSISKNTPLLAVLCMCQLAGTSARFANINFSVGITVAEDSHRLSEEMVRLCAKETDISMDELTKLRQPHENGSPNVGATVGSPSEATKCFIHCIYEQMGIVRDNVFVDRDFIGLVGTATDPMYQAQKHCHEIQAENKCERAYKIHKCLQEKRIAHGGTGWHHGHGLHGSGMGPNFAGGAPVAGAPAPVAGAPAGSSALEVKPVEKMPPREAEYPTARSVPMQYDMDD